MSATAPAGFFTPQANGMDASNKLPFFPKDFIGTVRVARCKGITVRDGGHRAFIAELEVVTSNMPETVRVGGRYSWFQSLKEVGTAYPACIGFLHACLGLDAVRDKAKIDALKAQQDTYLNMAVNEDITQYGGKINILGGQLVNLQTANKKLKDKVTDFTLHTWSPYVAPAAAATA